MNKILAFGDSNTWGFKPGTKTMERYSDNERWPKILQNMCTNSHIVEEGLCGRTTAYEDKNVNGRNGLKTLRQILQKETYDAIILMLGTNDCKTELALNEKDICNGAKQCIDEILKHISCSSVLLISPILLKEDVYKPDKDPEFNQTSVEICKKLKNEYKKLAKEEKISFLAASDFAYASDIDCEHMDAQGHKNLAYAVYTKLCQMGVV